MKKRKQGVKVWKEPNFVLVFFLVFIFIIYGFFVYIALSPNVHGINMQKFATSRNTISSILYANRGSIYDQNGNILAVNVASYTVIAYLSETRTTDINNPLHVVDKEKTAKALAPIINMSEESILKLLNKTNSNGKPLYQVELGPGGRGITELTKQEIQKLKLPGIDFIENFKRFYPNGDFASYILGYAKQYEEKKTIDNKENIEYSIVGELGIEKQYEELLKGKNGYLEYQKDRYGYKIPDTPETRIDEEDGKDIYLTLDSNIQRFVESAVKDTAREYQSQWMSLTVMDAKTGEILGTGTSPSFDPNKKNITNWSNVLVSKAYEPGSTMKIFSYMCAVDSGNYNGNETLMSGSLKIGVDTINDWNDGWGWGEITFDEGFEFSSNVAAANLVQKVINKGQLYDCYQKFGFGTKTGIDLPNEISGTINFRYPIEVATASFGQGITTSVIQQLQGLTIIANDGHMLKPQIVKKIVDSKTNEEIYKMEIVKSEQLVKSSTVEKMQELMYNVINGNKRGTTGGYYKIDGFNIIGKTATAQIYDTSLKKYLEGGNNYIYSFSGMFPYNDPKIIIYATYQQPIWGASYGLSLAVKEVIKNVAKYKNIYEELEEKKETESIILTSYTNKKVEDVLKKLNNYKVIVLGNGSKVTNQYPKSGQTLVANDRIILLTNSSEFVMPDIIGWTKKEVMALMSLMNVDYEITGNGKVVSQSLEKNNKIEKDTVIKITLE